MPYLREVRKVQHAGRPRVRRLAPECPKRESLRGEESVPASPRLSGNKAALWPEHDPGLTRRAPQGGHGAAARAARPSRKDAHRGRQEAEAQKRGASARLGAGRGRVTVRRGTAAPVVQCPSLDPLPLGTLCSGIFIHCPLAWQWGWGVCWARQPDTGSWSGWSH